MKLRNIVESNALKWESIYKQGKSYMRYPDSNFVSLFFRHKSLIKKNGIFLDFGCGVGNNAEFLLNFTERTKLFLLDVSVTALNMAMKRLSMEEDKFGKQILSTLDGLNDVKFDFILAWQSLCYNTKNSFLRSFEKIISCLKENGVIIFSLLTTSDIKVRNSCSLGNNNYVVKNIPDQKGCYIFAIESSNELLSLLKPFPIDIVDYGRFCFYSEKRGGGIDEYYIVGRKRLVL